MDIDDIEEIQETATAEVRTEVRSSSKRGKVVIIDDEHPFDLDAFLSNYTGIPTSWSFPFPRF